MVRLKERGDTHTHIFIYCMYTYTQAYISDHKVSAGNKGYTALCKK